MAVNIEIKARASDFNRQKIIAETLCDIPTEQIWQEDIFFKISKGRLKLRIFDSGSGELIYYMRTDLNEPKVSQYEISVTNEPESLKNILSSSLGVRGVIKKQRTLYRIGHTRIHFDQVEDLGNFIELEFVMQDKISKNEALQTVQNLMKKLEIQDNHLINTAYIDMVPDYQ
ncbi:MAG: class IV adenylate cyclase [Bacteroidetes bacterium]|nr:class IV adenylate cyclase [Bacteroidota bacterium]